MDDNLKKGYIKQPYHSATKRYVQVLSLIASNESIEEYKYWHRKENIWKEIPEGIRRAGILNMEIYLNGNIEVMILETPLDFNWDEAFGRLATFEKQAEWENFMSKFQQSSEGKTSDQKWQIMEQIFNLEEIK